MYIFLGAKVFWGHFARFARFSRWVPNIIKIQQNSLKSCEKHSKPIKIHELLSKLIKFTENTQNQ